MMVDSERARAFARAEWERQQQAVADIQRHHGEMVPAAVLWPAVARLSATHVLIWQAPDDTTMEQTLEAMTQQVQGLPPLGLLQREAYHRQAEEMLERWRATSR
jgi:hypothetical protein